MNTSQANVSKPARAVVAEQPSQGIQMVPTLAPTSNHQHQHQHEGRKAMRIRGGGAARDCFLGAIECFLCFECCKVR
ncbi:hypothetical protein PNOK_0711300 [Pyrrhoderma noxium]|uniref:Uncharacterized protein n=1 Tax=Pyrrhoderma noxium TaxID=2282107 RepID=A0A286UBX4_9AGAM|nr:hypothetical protein PNOK_0711300 [Pyrrhoderma noxium]